jgi:hypothetical protein
MNALIDAAMDLFSRPLQNESAPPLLRIDSLKLRLPMAEGTPGRFGHFQRADHPTPVPWKDSVRGQRVDLPEPLTQRFDAMQLNLLFHFGAEDGISRRAKKHPSQQRLQVERCATNQQHLLATGSNL